jgi:hypothetical protein
MPKNPPRPRDANQLAKLILDLATGEKTDPIPKKSVPARAAGGKVGGAARAEALPAKKRSAIARKAAKARWSSKDD